MSSEWKCIFATIALLGVQLTWTVELSYGTPYLVSLGMSPVYTTLVWLAGPLSGLLVQPLVGYASDYSSFNIGRRRPFIIGGTVLVVMSIYLIAYAETISGRFSTNKEVVKTTSIAIAVLGFYVLDFSINAVQACVRILIVDVIKYEYQSKGNSWAGRMIGIGNVFGYFLGNLDLPKILPILGNSQMKVLCTLAAIILIITVTVTCVFTEESRVDIPIRENRNIWTPFREIWNEWKNLPKPIQHVCNVQFFSWIAWFPFLFYSSSWVSRSSNEGKVDVRDGAFALLIFALVSVSAGFLVPFLQTLNERLKLQKIWSISLYFFAITVLTSLVFQSAKYSTVVVSVLGICWAITLWIPFSLIGQYISLFQEEYVALEEVSDDVEDYSSIEGNINRQTQINAGIILGIHNIYLCIPQFVSSFISMIVFSLFESDPYGWAIRIGSIFSILAGTYTSVVQQPNTRPRKLH